MNETDGELVREARDGSPTAFEKLVRRHLSAGYAVALARVGEPAEAEDVVQDAFITALQKLEECRQPDRFRAWFLEIVRNRAHNVRRHLGIRATLPMEAASNLRGPDDPHRDAERGQLGDRLLEALQVLTTTEREVLLLHDFEGARHREIAEQLGITEGSARVHLSNGRRKLRERLGRDLLEET